MNLPNKLTMLRMIMIPLFMIVVLVPWNLGTITILGTPIATTQFIGAIIFAVASLTDWFDGYLARKNNLVTNFGKFADPLADKMLVMTAFVILVQQQLAPAWVVAIIVCRELAVTGLRLILAEQDGEVLAAAWPGKIKTATQMLAIILLYLNNVFFNNIHLPMADILLYVCLFFTIYSGIEYFVKNWHVFKGSM